MVVSRIDLYMWGFLILVTKSELEIIADLHFDILIMVKHLFRYSDYRNKSLIIFNDINATSLYRYLSANYTTAFNIALRLINNHYAKLKRLRKRLQLMFDSNTCLFLTLTFTNDYISSTSAKTRRDYITRYLRQFNTFAVANIDFGDINEREHYHAVLLRDRVDFNGWHYGNLDVRVINNSTDDVKAVSSYVLKLSNHALKESTRCNCNLIYIKPKVR